MSCRKAASPLIRHEFAAQIVVRRGRLFVRGVGEKPGKFSRFSEPVAAKQGTSADPFPANLSPGQQG